MSENTSGPNFLAGLSEQSGSTDVALPDLPWLGLVATSNVGTMANGSTPDVGQFQAAGSLQATSNSGPVATQGSANVAELTEVPVRAELLAA